LPDVTNAAQYLHAVVGAAAMEVLPDVTNDDCMRVADRASARLVPAAPVLPDVTNAAQYLHAVVGAAAMEVLPDVTNDACMRVADRAIARLVPAAPVLPDVTPGACTRVDDRAVQAAPGTERGKIT